VLAAALGTRARGAGAGALGALVMGRGGLPGGGKDAKLHAGASKPGAQAGDVATAEALEAEKRSRASEEGAPDEEGEGSGPPVLATREDADDLDRLDPSARHAAHLAAPGGMAPVPTLDAANATADAPVRARSLEELLPLLVRKIAWAGDRHKGTVRLELGAGVYAGTTVIVHADAGRLRVEIDGHEGPELDRLRGRLDARLRGHGLDVESVT